MTRSFDEVDDTLGDIGVVFSNVAQDRERVTSGFGRLNDRAPHP